MYILLEYIYESYINEYDNILRTDYTIECHQGESWVPAQLQMNYFYSSVNIYKSVWNFHRSIDLDTSTAAYARWRKHLQNNKTNCSNV